MARVSSGMRPLLTRLSGGLVCVPGDVADFSHMNEDTLNIHDCVFNKIRS